MTARTDFLLDEIATTCNPETVRELREVINQLGRDASTDRLTGLRNRAFGTSNQVPPGQNLLVAVLDIDFFKRINDTFGHDQGDRVLQTFAETIESHVRREFPQEVGEAPGTFNTLITRWGGEEFAIFVAVPRGAMQETVTRLYRGLGAARHTLDTHPLLPDGGHITFSAGIGAATSDQEKQKQRAWETADKMLYDAKNEGRNHLRFGPLPEMIPRNLDVITFAEHARDRIASGDVDLATLPAGSCVNFKTRNRDYRLMKDEEGAFFIEGHPKFCPTPVRASASFSKNSNGVTALGLVLDPGTDRAHELTIPDVQVEQVIPPKASPQVEHSEDEQVR